MSQKLTFQAGNIVKPDRFYVDRSIDSELYAAILRKEHVYVLGPGQSGKSSLRPRIIPMLEREGYSIADTAINIFGNFEVGSSYDELISEISKQLDLSVSISTDVSPEERWRVFLLKLIYENSGPYIIIIDEVNMLAEYGEATRGVYAGIRAAQDAQLDRGYVNCIFFLITKIAPCDLIPDIAYSPFDRMTRFAPLDFTRHDLETFRPGLTEYAEDPDSLLNAVFDSLSGHPYQTQFIFYEIKSHKEKILSGCEHDVVNRLINKKLTPTGRTSDASLGECNWYLTGFGAVADNPTRQREALHLYERLKSENIIQDMSDLAQVDLWLSGIAGWRSHGSSGEYFLLVRNAVFANNYDGKWLAAQRIKSK